MRARPVGVKRVIALAILLAAVAAVAYLEKSMAGGVDVQLVYFLIALSGAVLLPRSVALAIAAGVAVVSAGLSGDRGGFLALNVLTHFMIYGYAALLTGNWERERRRLMQMSRIDELTGLHNLRALREQLPVWLGPAVRTKRPMAILMVDVDGFKAVNDRLGHTTGNELLKEIASLLRFSVRVGDEPFRFGGDEFVLLLSDADGPGATVVASRIQDMYATMGQTLRGTDVTIALSIGVALFPEDGTTPEALLTRADEALYQGKRAGGGRITRCEASAAA
ncbi:MAG: GGDEF domain-containing protein [Candidatus Dormibacteraeota bacterium]|nr:GGDEF domain-containing protein [Candidatus Dormibacteraeota bacterium]